MFLSCGSEASGASYVVNYPWFVPWAGSSPVPSDDVLVQGDYDVLLFWGTCPLIFPEWSR